MVSRNDAANHVREYGSQDLELLDERDLVLFLLFRDAEAGVQLWLSKQST